MNKKDKEKAKGVIKELLIKLDSMELRLHTIRMNKYERNILLSSIDIVRTQISILILYCGIK